jgi:hypothetical protein
MNCRRHASKPTLALWMLVAVADVALIVAAVGLMTVLLVTAGVTVVAACAAGTWLLLHRDATAPEAAPLPVRRRA